MNMNQPIESKATIPFTTRSFNPSVATRGCRIFVVLLVCCCVLPTAQAVNPPPVGGYPGANTAKGQNALLSLSSGTFNTLSDIGNSSDESLKL